LRAFLRAGRRELLGLSLSVVIPALNAAATLPDCLARLGNVDELVLVDGGSADATVRIAEGAGARVVISPKGRGRQLRAGGEAARGDWLLFLHADTCLSPDWKEAVEAHIRQHPKRPACFRLRLDDPAWQARLIERGVALRTGLLGLPYGDQGLLVPTGLYDRVGGYRPLPLMEDVDLVRRLPRIRQLPADAVTSAERWRRDGWARRSSRNLLCLAAYRAGMSAERVALLYERRA
jgi:rSAM/selenodomain-associated transferase 2